VPQKLLQHLPNMPEKLMVTGIILAEFARFLAMNYLESLAYIESLSPTLERPSLARITAFMTDLGNQQNRYPAFHIGGTNGKGSTAAVLDALLQQAGLSVGRFTGPHLLHWNERFHHNGAPVTDTEFADLASRVRQLSREFGERQPELGPLTWFEFLTVMAFIWFDEKHVDVAVFEVGLGGRFDATNILANVLSSAVTNVDLDHTHILGETVEEIAFEKSGIFKTGIRAVTAAEGPALLQLQKRAETVGSPFYRCQLPAQLVATECGGTAKSVDDALWQSLSAGFQQACGALNLLGSHQRLNALVAVSSLYLAALKSEFWGEILRDRLLATDGGETSGLERAFSSVYWPGRLQIVSSLNLVLDGAHNPAGAQILRQALDEIFPEQKLIFVISCFANKNADSMLSALLRSGDTVFISEAATRRPTCSKEELAAIAKELGAQPQMFHSIAQSVDAAMQSRQPGQPIVATGSFATVRETMSFIGWQSVEDGCGECVKISDGVSTGNAVRRG
jgi:dihydrofolate synthase/folylpolyglutamate synthase